MIIKLIRSKRGLSPIISAIFLMGILIAAISFSLSIIYPNVKKLNNQIDLEKNSSSIITLDSNLKELMINGIQGSFMQTMNLGDSGFLMSDTKSLSRIIFGTVDQSGIFSQLLTIPSIFYSSQSRIMIRQNLNTQVFSKNSHTYLIGSGDQNLFYLNSSSSANVPWSILNQSNYNSNFVYTSLSYRNKITIDKVLDSTSLALNITIGIQRVEFNYPSRLNISSTNPTLISTYNGLNVTTSNWSTIIYNAGNPQSFMMKTITSLLDPDSQNLFLTVEKPYKIEVPNNGSINVRIQFITHLIDLDLI